MNRNFSTHNAESDAEIFARALCDFAPRYAPHIGFVLNEKLLARLRDYYALVMRWNARLHLVAPCAPKEFATRHVLESLCAVRFLPEKARVVDIGSGAGLPIIPCLIARPSLRVSLIEANAKKCVFLREALHQLIDDTTSHQVIAARFEQTPAPQVDVLMCRAIERFSEMLLRLIAWSAASSFVFFGGEDLRDAIERLELNFSSTLLPDTTQRYLFYVTREAN